MSATYSGKVALVTGGAAGIGRATALAFAAEGLQVVVSDLDSVGGEGTIELIRAAGGEAIFVRCDVSRDEQVVALMAAIKEQYGRLDYASTMPGSKSRRASSTRQRGRVRRHHGRQRQGRCGCA